MANSTPHKDQRDKYMAFALAAADLLIEVSATGDILSAIGATQALLGCKSQTLIGRRTDALFSGGDIPLVERLRHNAFEVGRIQPAILHLKPLGDKPVAVNVGMCALPGQRSVCMSLSLVGQPLADTLPKRDSLTGLVALSDFQHMAERGISPNDPGSGAAMLREMRLVKIGGLTRGVKSLGDRRGASLMSEIGAILNASSVDGGQAACLGGDSFGLIGRSDGAITDETRLAEDIGQTLRAAGLDEKIASPKVMSVRLANDGLKEHEAKRALAYIFGNLAKSDFVAPQSLESAFVEAERDVVAKFTALRAVIDLRQFDLHFQPVVDLQIGTTKHFEALVRFGKYNKPFETIRFAESVGLIGDLDIAVCLKGIEALKANETASLAVNISGFSIQSDVFRERFFKLLHENVAMSGRLLFEVTESHQIEDLESAGKFLAGLRRRGFAVCLDDFGAGAAAYNYLRNLEVDYLKIDGEFLKRAMKDKRERALLKSIAVLCGELGCRSIGEMIETPQMAEFALEIGLSLGQGYLYGKPSEILPDARPSPQNGRRVGQVAGWH